MTLPVSGHQSLAEVKDLIRAKDIEIAVVDKNYSQLNRPDWKQSQAGHTWFTEWTALKSRYNAAKSPLNHAVGEWTPLPDNLIDDQKEFDDILEALENYTGLAAMWNGPQEGVVLPGSFQDLYNRLNAVSPTLRAQDRSIGKLIQPNPKSDASETIFKVLEPLDPIGSKKTASKWETYAKVGAVAAVGVFAFVAAKEMFGPIGMMRRGVASARQTLLPRAPREFPPDSVWDEK